MKRLTQLLAALALCLASAGGAAAQPDHAPGAWAPAAAPAGYDSPNAQWIKADGRNGRKFLAAVFRPPGAGPFPVVVLLQGAAGLLPVHLALADDTARAGFLVVVGCWQFVASPPAPVPNPVCSEATPQAEWQADPTANSGNELIAAAKTLPGARADRVGLYGLSRGGHAALWAASTGAGVQAVVADAPAHFTGWVTPGAPSTLDVVGGLAAPVLMFHGTADTTVRVEESREYERAARALGKPITAVYYEGVGHTPTFVNPTRVESEPLARARRGVEADARQRTIAFLREHLLGSGSDAVGAWNPAAAPAGLGAPGRQWMRLSAPNGRALLAAVVRPPGAGPFPVVVVLHGASGLQEPYLSVADDLAAAGFLAVAGCWQVVDPDPATRPPGPPPLPGATADCTGAPPQAAWVADPAANSGKELIAGARTLPGARADRVGLFGGSRGGHAALWAASTGADVQAVVVSAPAHLGYSVPPAPSTLNVVAGLRAPLLLLHGTADPLVPVEQSREYERAARALGKRIEAVYFEGVGHNPAVRPESRAEARRRAIAFLRANLLGATAPAQLPRTGEPAVSLPVAAALGVGLLGLGLAVRRRASVRAGRQSQCLSACRKEP